MREYTDDYIRYALFDQECAARQVDDMDRSALEAIEREVDAKFYRWKRSVRQS